MPVTKSAKRALRTARRRHSENLTTKNAYKQAVKAVRKAVETGAGEAASLMSAAQRALDTAAKSKAIHRNKAARLKSRLSKKLAGGTAAAAPVAKAKKTTAKKAAPKKKAAAKKK